MHTENLSMNSGIALDKQALTEIYERYSPDIFRYAYRVLDDNELAEDCVAETFHRFIIAIRGGALVKNIRAYLYRVAHNWITEHYRHQPLPAFPLEEDIHSDRDGKPTQLVESKLDRQRVRTALLRLPSDQRQVIELMFMENWSHNEVAEVLERSVDATRALQDSAVEALRKILSE
jgi:RNA polymerase sigma-70 factor (ECF subfamily)